MYIITSIAIVIEWFRNDENTERNDIIINLNIDNERGIYIDESRNIDCMHLNNNEIKKLRTIFILNNKDLLKLPLYGQNCSICSDSLDNVKKKVVKLPKCDHLFHWK